jgi:hypothetical protein
MVRDYDLFACVGVPPLLVTSSLGNEGKSVALENPGYLLGFHPGLFGSRQASTSTSKTFSSGLRLTGTGSR